MDESYKKFVEMFEHVCTTYTDKAALTHLRNDGSKDDTTFAEVLKHARAAQELFANAGLRPGDRAAIISPHTPFGVLAGFSLAYANITTVLIDATLPPEEINRLFAFSDVRAAFMTPAIYEITNKELLDGIPVFDLSQSGAGYKTFTGSPDTVTREATADPELDVISILFSSGTTASMKGVMIRYAAVVIAYPKFIRLGNLSAKDSFLFVLPFNHVAGFFCGFQYFLAGSGMGMIEDIAAPKIADAFHSYEPHVFALVPKFFEIVEQKIRLAIHEKGPFVERVLYMLLGLSRFCRKNFGINLGKVLFKSIRARVFGKNLYIFGLGASTCKKSTTAFYLDLGISVWANFYSLTETYVPTIATCVFDRYPAGTEGKVGHFDDIDVKIHAPDETGAGEIRIKTALIMKGYFRDPELTAASFDEDGYFKTGDLGSIDNKGYLHVTGRIKEAIHMLTGKKVAPSDVDALYGTLCPDTLIAACAVPYRDGSHDEIHLFVEKGELSMQRLQEIRNTIMDFSMNTSTLYKISVIHFINKIPVTTVGKIKRYLLKEKAIAERPAEKRNTEEPLPHAASAGGSGGNVKTVILNIITRHADGLPVTLNSRLKNELGFDSLKMMEMCVDIEGALNIHIAENMGKVETVRDVITLAENGGAAGCDVMYNINNYPLPKTKRHIRRLKLYMWLSRLMWRLDVSGLENIPTSGKYILCPNHQSYLDTICIWAAIGRERVDLNKICSLAADDHITSEFTFAMLGGIPVARSGNTIPAMKRGLTSIQNGYTMLIYPEGTRTLDGKIATFKGGAAKLAIDADVPVIPVRIDGAWEIFPPHKKRPKISLKRYPIKISFGKPIAPNGKKFEEMTAQIQSAVEQLVE